QEPKNAMPVQVLCHRATVPATKQSPHGSTLAPYRSERHGEGHPSPLYDDEPPSPPGGLAILPKALASTGPAARSLPCRPRATGRAGRPATPAAPGRAAPPPAMTGPGGELLPATSAQTVPTPKPHRAR